MMRMRQECTPPDGQDPQYQEFYKLYAEFVPAPTFFTLPLPSGWGKKKTNRAPRVMPPAFVSGNQFKNFFEEKKRKEEEKKEAQEKKIWREENKKRKEAEKQQAKEKKKAEREAKKAEKRAAQRRGGKGKRRKTVICDSDTDESDENVPFDDDSSCESLLLFDENKCCVCGEGENDSGWIGCECKRWFHKTCACRSERNEEIIMNMNDEELAEYDFVCDFCV